MSALLEITEVVIHPIPEAKRAPGSPLLGFARIVLNGAFVVSSIKIVAGRFGLFIAWPRERVIRGEEAKDYNIAFPISKDVQTRFSERILAEYQHAVR